MIGSKNRKKVPLQELNLLKLNCDYSQERVHFLDVQVILEINEISTDLYVKETDSHQYLHPSSCHPYHCVKSIPYSQALRLNQICSNNIFYDNRCNQLEKWLSDRNYKQELVREQILKARAISRETLLKACVRYFLKIYHTSDLITQMNLQ